MSGFSAESARNIITGCGFDLRALLHKVDSIAHLRPDWEGERADRLLVGFDINGPLSLSDSAELVPYPLSRDCIDLLSTHHGVERVLITGWDLETARAFSVSLSGEVWPNIIAEKGRIIASSAGTRLVGRSSKAALDVFGRVLIEWAAEKGAQVAIQANQSSACQCVYFEAFERSKLHLRRKAPPCADDLRRIERACHALHLDTSPVPEGLRLRALPAQLYSLVKDHALLLPIRLTRDRDHHDSWTVRIDEHDDRSVALSDVQRLANDIALRTNRVATVNADFSVDFEVAYPANRQSDKAAALGMLAELVGQGQPILQTNTGDSPDDRIDGRDALFFPQIGTRAIGDATDREIPVLDGREYAVVLALWLHGARSR